MRARKVAVAALVVSITIAWTASIASCSRDISGPYVVSPPRFGTLRVSIETTGEGEYPAEYTVVEEKNWTRSIPTQGEIEIRDVVAGYHRIKLASLASNCWLASVREVEVKIAGDSVSLVKFTIHCLSILDNETGDLPPGTWNLLHWEFFLDSTYSSVLSDVVELGITGHLDAADTGNAGIDWEWRDFSLALPGNPPTLWGIVVREGRLIRSDILGSQPGARCFEGDCDGPLHGANRTFQSGDTLVVEHVGTVDYALQELLFFDVVPAWSRVMLIRQR